MLGWKGAAVGAFSNVEKIKKTAVLILQFHTSLKTGKNVTKSFFTLRHWYFGQPIKSARPCQAFSAVYWVRQVAHPKIVVLLGVITIVLATLTVLSLLSWAVMTTNRAISFVVTPPKERKPVQLLSLSLIFLTNVYKPSWNRESNQLRLSEASVT